MFVISKEGNTARVLFVIRMSSRVLSQFQHILAHYCATTIKHYANMTHV